jgi:hypothetical protein
LQFGFPLVYSSGIGTTIYENCNVTNFMATAGHTGGVFLETNGYRNELIVKNSTFINIQGGGSTYGVDGGLFKFTTSIFQSWYLIEVCFKKYY